MFNTMDRPVDPLEQQVPQLSLLLKTPADKDKVMWSISGVDAEEGFFKRVVLIGDAYIKTIADNWDREVSAVKPYIIWSNCMTLGYLSELIINHRFFSGPDHILVICAVGLSHLTFMNRKFCELKRHSFLYPDISPMLLSAPFENFVASFMNLLSILRNIWRHKMDRRGSVYLLELPKVDLTSIQEEVFIDKRNLVNCQCHFPLSDQQLWQNAKVSAKVVAFNSFLTKSPLNMCRINGLRPLKMSDCSVHFKENMWQLQPTSYADFRNQVVDLCSTLIEAKKPFFPSMTPATFRFIENYDVRMLAVETLEYLIILGDWWLEQLIVEWPEDCHPRPSFLHCDRVEPHVIEEILLKHTHPVQRGTVLICPSVFNLTYLQPHKGCVGHSPVQVLLPLLDVVQYPSYRADTTVMKLGMLKNSILAKRPFLHLVFTPMYPIGEMLHSLFELVHNEHTIEHNHKILWNTEISPVLFKMHSDKLIETEYYLNYKLLSLNGVNHDTTPFCNVLQQMMAGPFVNPVKRSKIPNLPWISKMGKEVARLLQFNGLRFSGADMPVPYPKHHGNQSHPSPGFHVTQNPPGPMAGVTAQDSLPMPSSLPRGKPQVEITSGPMGGVPSSTRPPTSFPPLPTGMSPTPGSPPAMGMSPVPAMIGPLTELPAVTIMSGPIMGVPPPSVLTPSSVVIGAPPILATGTPVKESPHSVTTIGSDSDTVPPSVQGREEEQVLDQVEVPPGEEEVSPEEVPGELGRFTPDGSSKVSLRIEGKSRPRFGHVAFEYGQKGLATEVKVVGLEVGLLEAEEVSKGIEEDSGEEHTYEEKEQVPDAEMSGHEEEESMEPINAMPNGEDSTEMAEMWGSNVDPGTGDDQEELAEEVDESSTKREPSVEVDLLGSEEKEASEGEVAITEESLKEENSCISSAAEDESQSVIMAVDVKPSDAEGAPPSEDGLYHTESVSALKSLAFVPRAIVRQSVECKDECVEVETLKEEINLSPVARKETPPRRTSRKESRSPSKHKSRTPSRSKSRSRSSSYRRRSSSSRSPRRSRRHSRRSRSSSSRRSRSSSPRRSYSPRRSRSPYRRRYHSEYDHRRPRFVPQRGGYYPRRRFPYPPRRRFMHPRGRYYNPHHERSPPSPHERYYHMKTHHHERYYPEESPYTRERYYPEERHDRDDLDRGESSHSRRRRKRVSSSSSSERVSPHQRRSREVEESPVRRVEVVSPPSEGEIRSPTPKQRSRELPEPPQLTPGEKRKKKKKQQHQEWPEGDEGEAKPVKWLKGFPKRISESESLTPLQKKGFQDMWAAQEEEYNAYVLSPKAHAAYAEERKMWKARIRGTDAENLLPWNVFWLMRLEEKFRAEWTEKEKHCLKFIERDSGGAKVLMMGKEVEEEKAETSHKRKRRATSGGSVEREGLVRSILEEVEAADVPSEELAPSAEMRREPGSEEGSSSEESAKASKKKKKKQKVKKKKAKKVSTSESEEEKSHSRKKKRKSTVEEDIVSSSTMAAPHEEESPLDILKSINPVSDLLGPLAPAYLDILTNVQEAHVSGQDQELLLKGETMSLLKAILDKLNALVGKMDGAPVQKALVQGAATKLGRLIMGLSKTSSKNELSEVDLKALSRATKGKDSKEILEIIHSTLQQANVSLSQEQLLALFSECLKGS